jgi:hypothetical protein
VVSAVRLVPGAVCLLRPAAVVHGAGGVVDDHAVLWARALGARELAQSLVTLVRPERGVVLTGVAGDALHALTALAAGAVWPRQRKAALLNATAASSWAVLSGVLAR